MMTADVAEGPPPLTQAGAERLARIASVLTAAALANKYVRAYLREHAGRPRPLWTEDAVRRNPPVRVEFEHVIGLGGPGETMAACRGKPTFGELVGILPVEPLDPVGEGNIVYVYKDSSPYNRRVEQRRWMKARLAALGTGYRCLVGIAMGVPKGEFVAWTGGACRNFGGGLSGATAAVKIALGWDLGTFWRMARGKGWAEIPKPAIQGTLFDGGADDPDDIEVVRVERAARPKPPPLLTLGVLGIERKPRPVQGVLFDDAA